MKKLPTVAMLAIAALALSGCTATAGDAPETASPQPVAVEPAPTATPTPTKPVDVKAAKAEAIAAGRPEAAWDKKCVAWEMPKADTKGQAWANKLGTEFLEINEAACPDQILYPTYYIESFKPGVPGELVVIVDQDMNRILHSNDGRYEDLVVLANGVLEELAQTNPSLEKVTAQLPNGDKRGSSNPLPAA